MDLSVVIPIYRCAATLDELCERLDHELVRLPGVRDYEIILVEDGGPDGSWELIKEIAARRPNVRGAQLSRNFGQHSAITAGLLLSRGSWAVAMDGDLQDRPEDIKRLWIRVGPEVDMVCARRRKKEHSWWRRLGSKLVFKAFSIASGVRLDPEVTNFRVMNRTVVETYLSLGGQNRNLGPNMQWLGFNTVYEDLAHDARAEGKSSYTFSSLAKLATDTIISHSNRPLMLSVWFGGGICLITLCVMSFAFYAWLRHGSAVSGWTSLILSIWFLGGAIIANLGLLGIYLGKIYDESKGRPSFVIARTVNIAEAIPDHRKPPTLVTSHDASR